MKEKGIKILDVKSTRLGSKLDSKSDLPRETNHEALTTQKKKKLFMFSKMSISNPVNYTFKYEKQTARSNRSEATELKSASMRKNKVPKLDFTKL